MTKLDNAKFIGMIHGRRIYSERRGLNHVQDAKQPNCAVFTGSIRECERALRGKFQRFHKN